MITASIKESREAIDAAPEKSKEKIISLIASEISKYPKIDELKVTIQCKNVLILSLNIE